MTIRVTQTQKLIAEAALGAVGADNLASNPEIIEDVVRAMLVIEQGHMQAYMLRGFKWSHRSRFLQDPEKVRGERAELDQSVAWFQRHIDEAQGEAARRIRGNRKRRIKEMFLEALQAQRYAGQQLRELELRRRDMFNPEAANWDEEPRHLPMGLPNEGVA